MILLPDLSRVCVDPFFRTTNHQNFLFVLDPNTRKPYDAALARLQKPRKTI